MKEAPVVALLTNRWERKRSRVTNARTRTRMGGKETEREE